MRDVLVVAGICLLLMALQIFAASGSILGLILLAIAGTCLVMGGGAIHAIRS